MSIITRTRTEVKPRNAARRFGQGILPSYPTHRLDCTVSDMAEMAQVFGEISDARDAALDREYDRRAEESAALDRLEMGLCF